MVDEKFHPEEILKLEFEYASRTAEQAQDDRTAIVNLYLLIAGGVGSIISAASGLPPIVYLLTLGLVGVAGFFAVFQLVRLRQSWNDSALAMNRIKDFYLQKFPALELDKAFRWRTETIPPLDKLATITFNLALLVMIIDSIALGVAFFFASPIFGTHEYIFPVSIAIIYFLVQLRFNFFQLKNG